MGLSRALSLFARTMAFLPWRFFLGVSSAALLIFSVMACLAVARGVAGTDQLGLAVDVLGGIVGFGLWIGVMLGLRGLVLAKVRLPHAAAMVALLDGDAVPGGQAQVMTARSIVQTQLGSSGALSRLDRLVRAVVLDTATLADEGMGAGESGNRPGFFDRIRRLFRRIEVGAISEAVLAHALRDPTENGWDRAHDGTVLFAQNSGRLLGISGRLVMSGWCFAAMFFLALLEPAAWLAALAPGALESGSAALTLGLSLALAWGVKAALIDPVVSACVLQLFLGTTKGQKPNAEWRGMLVYSVPAFRTLGEGAVAWKPGAKVRLASQA